MTALADRLAELESRARSQAAEIEVLSTVDSPTPNQLGRLERLVDSAKVLRGEIDQTNAYLRDEALEQVRRYASNPRFVEPAVGPLNGDFGVMKRTEPWAEVSRFNDSPELRRDRALAALDESMSPGHERMPVAPEDRERMERIVREDAHPDGRGDVADYTIAASNPAYERAFSRFLQGRTELWSDEERHAVAAVERTRIRMESRTALSTAGANGGYMIPFFLDPSIVLANAGAMNPFRQIARVETIPTNVWHGVSSAGVTAEWTSEAAEFTDASPTFAQPTVTPIKADAYVQASWELAQDSNIAAQLGMLFADAKNVLETTAFTTGTGSTQPEGIVTRLSVTTASKVAASTNGSFGAVDLYALVNSLPARAQDSARWMAHWGIANLIRQFGAGAGTANYWTDMPGPTPAELLGAPFHRNSAMTSSLSAATASTDNILILGDWSRFLIVDRIGMEVVVNPLVLGTNRRPTGEMGWAAWWRTGSDTTDPSQFRMLQV